MGNMGKKKKRSVYLVLFIICSAKILSMKV